VQLRDAGFRHDVVEAVLAEQTANPFGARTSVQQLQEWTGREDWKTILPAFSRCVRITRDQKRTFAVTPAGLIEREEQALFRAVRKAEAAVRASGRADADSLLAAFVPMIPVVNAFFEQVLVMDKKKALRENRLGLLQRIAGLAGGIADLSKLEGF